MTNYIYNKNAFSRHIKELRLSKKLTQKQMEAYVEVSQGTISKWETNPTNNQPYRSSTNRVAEKFNVNLAWLLEGKGPKHPPKPYEIEETPAISTVVEQKGLHAKTRRVETPEGEVAVSLYLPDRTWIHTAIDEIFDTKDSKIIRALEYMILACQHEIEEAHKLEERITRIENIINGSRPPKGIEERREAWTLIFQDIMNNPNSGVKAN